MCIQSEKNNTLEISGVFLVLFDYFNWWRIWIIVTHSRKKKEISWYFMQNVKRSKPNWSIRRPKKNSTFSVVFFHFFSTSTNCARKRLEWIMNSVFNNSNEICCCNKEQCFTPTLLTWSSLQLSSKKFVNTTSETGNYYFLRPQICYIFLWFKWPT